MRTTPDHRKPADHRKPNASRLHVAVAEGLTSLLNCRPQIRDLRDNPQILFRVRNALVLIPSNRVPHGLRWTVRLSQRCADRCQNRTRILHASSREQCRLLECRRALLVPWQSASASCKQRYLARADNALIHTNDHCRHIGAVTAGHCGGGPRRGHCSRVIDSSGRRRRIERVPSLAHGSSSIRQRLNST